MDALRSLPTHTRIRKIKPLPPTKKMPLQKSMPQRTPQSKSSNLPPHTDDSGSGGRHLPVQQKSSASAKTQAAKTNRQVQAVEGPPSRRMQKNSSSGSITTDSSNSSSLPFRNNTEQRAGGAPTRRRQSIREQNTTIGPRNGDPVKRYLLFFTCFYLCFVSELTVTLVHYYL